MHKMCSQITVGSSNVGGYPRSGSLVETDWLEANIDNPTLRIFDCSAYFHADPGTGINNWRNGHIPGSAYVDLLEDLSDPDSDLPLMMPTPERFSQVMGGLGLGRGTTAVLYDDTDNICAARLW